MPQLKFFQQGFHEQGAVWKMPLASRPPVASVQIIPDLVLAATALHNFTRSQKSTQQVYSTPELDREEVGSGVVVPGQWRSEAPPESMLDIRTGSSNTYPSDYFNSPEGAVSWQWNLFQ